MKYQVYYGSILPPLPQDIALRQALRRLPRPSLEQVHTQTQSALRIRNGGTRKIADVPRPCNDPSHNPPAHMVFEPGVYEHVCPSCGKRVVFTVGGIYW